MMHVAYTLGRICVPVVFIVSGVQHFLNIAGFAKYMADNKIPLPDEIATYLGGIPKFEALAYLCAAIEVVCGLMILIGLKARWAALLLIVYTACAIFFIHHFWDMEAAVATANQAHALKNLSIIGALLLIVAVGSGGASMDGRPVE